MLQKKNKLQELKEEGKVKEDLLLVLSVNTDFVSQMQMLHISPLERAQEHFNIHTWAKFLYEKADIYIIAKADLCTQISLHG